MTGMARRKGDASWQQPKPVHACIRSTTRCRLPAAAAAARQIENCTERSHTCAAQQAAGRQPTRAARQTATQSRRLRSAAAPPGATAPPGHPAAAPAARVSARRLRHSLPVPPVVEGVFVDEGPESQKGGGKESNTTVSARRLRLLPASCREKSGQDRNAQGRCGIEIWRKRRQHACQKPTSSHAACAACSGSRVQSAEWG